MSQIKTLDHSWLGGRFRVRQLDNDPSKSENIGYHPNGQLQFKYPLLNGEMDGVCQCWHENGQLGVYEVYENGKKHGLRKEWYPNGNLKSQLGYYNGLPFGSHKSWYETGQISLEESYARGVPHGKRTKYYSNGILKFTGSFENGRANGMHKTWYETGFQCLEEFFKQDKLHGPCTQWFPNGVKIQTTYRNNIKDGVKKIWNERKRLVSEVNYRRNLLHGRSLYWHANGQLKIRDQYLVGIRHGVMAVYDETGKLLDKKIFIRGVSVPNRLNNLIKSGDLNASHILNENNLEVRRICIEELGYANFLSQVDYTIVDKKDEYELIRIFLSEREESIHLVKVKCPSTGAFYTLRVPPSVQTVKEAVAWTFNIEEQEYNPEIET